MEKSPCASEGIPPWPRIRFWEGEGSQGKSPLTGRQGEQTPVQTLPTAQGQLWPSRVCLPACLSYTHARTHMHRLSLPSLPA